MRRHRGRLGPIGFEPGLEAFRIVVGAHGTACGASLINPPAHAVDKRAFVNGARQDPGKRASLSACALLGRLLGLDIFAPGYGVDAMGGILLVGLGAGLGRRVLRGWLAKRQDTDDAV